MARLALQIKDDEFIEVATFGRPKEYQDHVHGFMRFLSRRMTKRIEDVIEKGGRGRRWPKLSDQWTDFKKKMNLDPGKWTASGQLRNSIKWWHSRSRKSYFVGVNPTKLHRVYTEGGTFATKRTRTKLVDILAALEFGTRKIPPRPLFVPVMNEFKRDLRKHYADYVAGKRP